jgi:rRNA-processing protein EBP2
MARKSKLLAALDAHKGRDYESEKRAKKVKAAERRKREKAQALQEDNTAAANGENRISASKDQQPASEQEEGAEEVEDNFEDFSGDEEEAEDKGNQDAADDAPTASEADPDSDVPLSELSEEDRADTIPHQRLTINNTAALLASTKQVAVTRPKMKFSAHNSLILTSLPPASTSIPDPNDDLTRELEFYRICRTAATDARALLKKERIPFARPSDYFAEMVKSDEHMGKVKKKMYDEAANKKAAAEARRVRDAKKFGKAVQIAKEQERAKEKRQTLEKIKSLKRSMHYILSRLLRCPLTFSTERKGQDTGTVHEGDDLFEKIDVEATNGNPDRRTGPGRAGGSNFKRQKRDEKFGFGGKKRFSKSGDAVSTADMRDFSAKKMKAGGRSGTKRLGKSRRAAAR